jgi:Cupin domain
MHLTAVALGLLLLGAVATPAPALAQQQPKDSLLLLESSAITGWREGKPGGVAGLQLLGSAWEPGPYVARTRFAPGRGLGPHSHAQATAITVLQGRFHLGIGEIVDSTKARGYPPGSFLVIPGGVPHYEWGEGETVIQLSGIGPLGYTDLAPDR